MASGKKTAKKAIKPKKPASPARKPAKKPASAPKKPASKKPAPKKAAPRPAPKKAAPKPAAKKAVPAPKKSAAPPKKAAAPPPKAAPAKAAKPTPAPAKPAKPAPAPKAAAPAPAPAAPPAPTPKATKKKPIPTTSITATPVIRPLAQMGAPTIAPPPPPAKPGHVDHQVLSAITYGLFSAINKTFGFAGQSVVKNASLRMLEYGYKRGWLPPKSKEPVRALNEFFGRLETMGYAEKLHVAKRGEGYALEIQGLADFDALHELRVLHYPLLPFFLGEMLQAILDQYFQLKVTMAPMEVNEQRRGVTLPFTIVERPAAPIMDTSRLVSSYKLDDFEE